MVRLRDQSGFTIVEALVAATVLLVGIFGTLAMLDTANKRSKTAANRQTAVALVRDVVEVVRGVPYSEVSAETLVPRLQQQEGLGGDAGDTWRIRRGAMSFALTVEVCALDDPADGVGPHGGGAFCAGGVAPGTVDANPLDYKRVTVTAAWVEGSETRSVKQSTIVTARGGDLPSVASLTLTAPAAPVVTSTSVTGATFAARTAVVASAVTWAVDGVQQGSAAGDGRDWTFSWQLPSVDGAYEVSAQAFDSSGATGTARSLTFTINRFPPAAPRDFNAGRNGAVVEAEWSANAERDVIGYRVYRQARNGSVTLACPFTTATSCIDPSPPAENRDWLNYWVVAVDRDPAGAEREGSISAKLDVNIGNRAPSPPTNLRLAEDTDGNLVLTWKTPKPDDPDKGDYIDSFRIYRDGTTVGNRYDRVEGADEEYVDADADDATHQYWITSVDAHLHESTVVGPVSG